MVSAGMAWAFTRYSLDYAGLELAAAADGLGVHWVEWWVGSSLLAENVAIQGFSAHRMADGVGFEPTVGVNPRRFSRPVP
jgi:hypothetical protein